ncbi:MAG: FAD binding domain-containing protein, partial [Armatimonadota bacterium]
LLIMKEGLVRYRHLVDLKTIPGLNEIHYDPASGTLRIGATATHREVEQHPGIRQYFPIVSEVENLVANVRVRNVGTLGGNLCFAEPHADPGTLFLTFDTEVELSRDGGARNVPLGEFFVGPYETARQPDEVLTRLLVRRWGDHTRGAYLKFGYHERPTLGAAVALTLDTGHAAVADVRIAVGCVAPTPLRMSRAEDVLRGLVLADADQRIDEAAASAADDVDAVSDLHGSAEYKKAMVKVFVRRAYRVARARFETDPPREISSQGTPA